MLNGFRIGAVNAVKGLGAAVVLGAGFTLGAAMCRAGLEALSSAANKLADNKGTARKVERKVAQATETVATAA